RDFHVTGVQTCALPIYMQGGAGHEQGKRALDRHRKETLHYDNEREGRGYEHDEAHGPDLAHHDLEGRDGHCQKVFNGSMLALAEIGRASWRGRLMVRGA